MAHHVMTTTIYLRRLPLLLESLAPVFLINLTDLELPHVGVSLLDLRIASTSVGSCGRARVAEALGTVRVDMREQQRYSYSAPCS